MRTLTLEGILARLERVLPAGPGRWVAKCPSHQDRRPSLSIGEGRGSKVLLFCFAGCRFQDITAALGVQPESAADTLPRAAWGTHSTGDAARRTGYAAHIERRECNTRRPITLPEDASRRSTPSRHEVKAIGPVTEAQIRALEEYGYRFSRELYQEAATFAVRVKNRETGKNYTALGFKGFVGFDEGWKLWAVSENGRLWRDEGTGKLRRFNIGPADLIVARSLWNFFPMERLVVMEGESDLLAYLKLGDRNVITTSCGAGNTSAFKRPDAVMWLRYKKPREIYVYGDNDEAGRKGAKMRAEVLKAILPGARIFLPRLPERFSDFRDLIGGEKENAIGSN